MSKTRYVLIALAIAAFSTFAQSQTLIKRSTTKTDRFDFGSGGTVSIVGAPTGSVRVEGWNNNEIGITAEIELQAASEADLAKLAEVTGFVTVESIGRTGIVSIGTHDKGSLKKSGKKLPKNLLGLPFRIDYVINVPRYCDLEIDGGKGDLNVSGVEGSIRVNFLETHAKLAIISGSTNATIGNGTVDVDLGVRGWRGRSADIKLATGNLTIRLPANTSAEIDALILKSGKIENILTGLKPRDRKVVFTDRSIIAKAGAGGAPLKFTVGDGTLRLEPLEKP